MEEIQKDYGKEKILENKGGSEEEFLKKPGIFQVGILYSVAVSLLVFIGAIAQHWDLYKGLLITEFILILVPPVVFLLIFRFDIRKVLRLNNPGILNLFIAFWIMVFALPVVGVFNLLNLWLIRSIFGKIEVIQPPVAENLGELIISLFVIAVSAGICEEVLFRGVIQRGFERVGSKKSIIIAGLLFGLMHVDFQRFLGTFLLGCLIGFLVYRSNSLLTGMFAHFTNNALATILSFVALMADKFIKDMNIEELTSLNELGIIGSSKALLGNFFGVMAPTVNGDIFSQFSKLSPMELAIVIIFYIIMFLVCGGIFIILIKLFMKNTSRMVKTVEKDEEKILPLKYLGVLPGLGVVGYVYYLQLARFLNF